jgi:hypothetical protein
MSTKTTFKRIALVAVAALGLGVMSVAPSNAVAQLDSLAVSLASTTQKTTETLTATASVLTATLAGTKGVDTLTVTASIVSGPAYVQPVLAFKESTTAVASTTADSSVQTVTPNDTSTVSQATAKYNVYLKAPSVAGTYVVKITPTGGVNAAAVTVSIVVSTITYAAATAAATKSFMYSALTAQNASVTKADGTFGYLIGNQVGNTHAQALETMTAQACASGVLPETDNGCHADTHSYLVTTNDAGKNVASIFVYANNGVQAIASGNVQSAAPMSVKIDGPGYVSVGVSDYVYGKTAVEGDWGYNYVTKHIAVRSDGTTGKATITATIGGVVVATKIINFTGATASYAFGTPTKTVTGVGETSSVTITSADAAGVATNIGSGVYAFSSDTSVATVNSTQSATVVVTGVKSGTATITVGNASTLATSTITKTLAVKVGAITAKTVAFSMSPTAPQPGEKVTLTVTATDASGNPVGDGSRNLFTSAGITTGLAVQGATWTAAAAVTLVGGTASYTFYAPTGTGSLEVSATEGSSTDSTTKAAITGSITIVNSAVDAATDAANEAYDAANAATDAALAAAEAADAATVAAQEASDAVAALSESVTKLIAGLQAQIKSLAAVVAKIAKKVKA